MNLTTKGNAKSFKELPVKVQEILKKKLTETRTRNWYFEQCPDGKIYQSEDSYYTAILGDEVIRSWQPMGEWSIHASNDPLENSTSKTIRFEPGYFVIEHRIFMGKHLFAVYHVGLPALESGKEKVGANRGYTDIITDLEKIENDPKEKNHKVRIMAEALHWGYASARTNHILEQRLYRLTNLRSLVELLAAQWDGKDYLNGALYVANHHFTEPLY